jgi:protein-L-isoaspartate(D-aspartate) O-methyltransferase
MSDPRLHGIGMTSARTRERLIQRLREQRIQDPRVLDRIRAVPRHLFVDEALASRAYEDTALPIGFGQTISQPYIVARMTEALVSGTQLHNVLEIGTGCGYQSAVLAPLVTRLSTIERVKPLLDRARARLKDLGIRNVRFRYGDGTLGWKAHAPYDGILVAAAPHAVPAALLEQLAPNGGRLVVPVGPDGSQELLRITRNDQHYSREKLGGVAFVPLLGGLA